MHSHMKNKEKRPRWTERKKQKYRNNQMTQDAFTFEGVLYTSPLGFGITEFEDWMFEKTKKKESAYEKEE